MNSMKIQIIVFAISVLALFSNFVTAEEVRYYDFEIIIFESLDEEGKISEVWKQDVVIEPPETIVTLGDPYPGPMPKEFNPKYTFKYLPKKSFRLVEELKSLEEDENYRVLLHAAWRQPGMPAKTTLPIRLHKEFIVTETTPTTLSDTPMATDPDMPAVNLPAPRETIRPAATQSRAILDGYLKIILSRYLHADFNLVYKKGLPLTPATTRTAVLSAEDEADSIATNEPVIVSYQLQQTRKMRSKEIHYIDHPVLGIIILAWPFKIEE